MLYVAHLYLQITFPCHKDVCFRWVLIKSLKVSLANCVDTNPKQTKSPSDALPREGYSVPISVTLHKSELTVLISDYTVASSSGTWIEFIAAADVPVETRVIPRNMLITAFSSKYW